MTRTFCTRGNSEVTKGLWHVGLLAGAVGALAYNASALWYRREWHLFVNTCVYAGAAAWETKKAWSHFQ